ncbi:hypothetical protein ACF1FC_33815, partial [Streptomyces sp. NPDC014344]|uniref:hypothetical protein n=1 Tax=Streptomyces sp. NPDC014344 TaxID=3364871 RepID=UPI0036FA7002
MSVLRPGDITDEVIQAMDTARRQGLQKDLRTLAARQFRLDQSVVGLGVPLTDAQWARIEPLLPDR